MSHDNSVRNSSWKIAAYAVAVAAAVSSPASADENATVARIQKYCAASWRNAGIKYQDWNDCTQDAITRLLERIPREQLPQAIENRHLRRELKRSVWSTIKRWRRTRGFQTLPESLAVFPTTSEWDEDIEPVLDTALTPVQKRIIELSRAGWKVREIAAELRMSPQRVSDEKYKAKMKLRHRTTRYA